MRSAILITLVSLCLVEAGLGDVTEQFRVANQFYEAKAYDSARAYYLQALEGGAESAAIHYNLGNVYFRQGDLGRAIGHYLKAQQLAPGDEDIANNLAFAKGLTSVQLEGTQLSPVRTLLEEYSRRFSMNTLTWLLSLTFIAAIVLLAVRFGLGIFNGALKAGLVTAVVLFGVASLSYYIKYRFEYQTKTGVIISRESPVTAGPTAQSDVELVGAPGLVVELLDETGEYYNVKLQNNRRGWVRKADVFVL